MLYIKTKNEQLLAVSDSIIKKYNICKNEAKLINRTIDPLVGLLKKYSCQPELDYCNVSFDWHTVAEMESTNPVDHLNSLVFKKAIHIRDNRYYASKDLFNLMMLFYCSEYEFCSSKKCAFCKKNIANNITEFGYYLLMFFAKKDKAKITKNQLLTDFPFLRFQ